MPSLNYTTAFNRYKAKLDNPNWAVSAISADGALVISCWEQYFERPADGVLRYVDSLSRWNGSNRAGWNLLRRHLEIWPEPSWYLMSTRIIAPVICIPTPGRLCL